MFILQGNSEIGVHMSSNLFYLICLSHFIESRAVTNRIIFFSFSGHACATCSGLLSNISTVMNIFYDLGLSLLAVFWLIILLKIYAPDIF